MHPKFSKVIDQLHSKFEELTTGQSFNFTTLPREMPSAGVYLFSENDKPLYVGRSNRLRERYKSHCRLGSKHNQAAFAYKLAHKALNLGPASYKPGPESRKGRSANAKFIEAFSAAKARVRGMQYRFVAEPDQKRQALLEMYCAIALDTEFNDFSTS
tara:strand:- start:92 stop:562 length:471 start_codon:yes stop_codon:yes gene_type:complete